MSVCLFHSTDHGNICWICLRGHWKNIKYDMRRKKGRKKIKAVIWEQNRPFNVVHNIQILVQLFLASFLA